MEKIQNQQYYKANPAVQKSTADSPKIFSTGRIQPVITPSIQPGRTTCANNTSFACTKIESPLTITYIDTFSASSFPLPCSYINILIIPFCNDL